MRCGHSPPPAPRRHGDGRRPDGGGFLGGQRAHGVRQVGHGAGAGAEVAGVGHGRLDVHAGPHRVTGRHGAAVDPVLAACRRHGLGGGQGIAGPSDGFRVVQVDHGQVGAAGVVADAHRPLPRRRPRGRDDDGRVGGGGGPSVADAGAAARARGPHVRPAAARVVRARGAVAERDLSPAQGSTGTPDAARLSAVCCGWSVGCVMLGYLQFLCWVLVGKGGPAFLAEGGGRPLLCPREMGRQVVSGRG